MYVQTFIQTYIQTLQRSPDFRIRPGRVARGTATAERFPLPEGAGRGSLPAQGCRGLKALDRGSGKGHPGGGVQRGEDTPLVRVVGGKAPCLNRVKYSVPTEWMRWRCQYFALLSYGKFFKFALSRKRWHCTYNTGTSEFVWQQIPHLISFVIV